MSKLVERIEVMPLTYTDNTFYQFRLGYLNMFKKVHVRFLILKLSRNIWKFSKYFDAV